MAEDLLDATQVGTALEQLGSGAVAQAVRAGIPDGSRLAQALVHDPAGRARIQVAAAYAEEQRWPAGRGGESGAARGQPADHRAERRHADRDRVFLVALSPDPDLAPAVVEMARVQPPQLADPATTCVHNPDLTRGFPQFTRSSAACHQATLDLADLTKAKIG